MTFRPLPSPQAMPGTTSTREGSDWRDRAACLDEDPELFFPIGTTAPGAQMQTAVAKSVCHGCEVEATCLRWALDTDLDYGVAGGLSEDERRAMKRRVRRRNSRATDPQKAPDKAPKKAFTDPITRAICGTGAGYRRHTDLNESKCEPCAEWRRTRAQDRPPCGTPNGYRDHVARKEAACAPCKAAKAAESVEYRRQKRTNAA